MNVINVAVTLGSKKERRDKRWEELTKACEYIGFGLLATVPEGLEGITLALRDNEPQAWSSAMDVIASILSAQEPAMIFIPHAQDGHTTHIGTHHLVTDALRTLPFFGCLVVETEYWTPMERPNLMVESSVDDVADLVTALSLHVGEVARNPYHLRLPAWMIDNVRRGAELVGGQGAQAPRFVFATLYTLYSWRGTMIKRVLDRGRLFSQQDTLDTLFVHGHHM
jgi:LmbE family N-acetylglucosaminyl deacetylase